ncbi:MAG: hypothetical protein PUG21_05495 [Prevotella sp.]|nr:hypothetical protein [Prevotella sp.]
MQRVHAAVEKRQFLTGQERQPHALRRPAAHPYHTAQPPNRHAKHATRTTHVRKEQGSSSLTDSFKKLF